MSDTAPMLPPDPPDGNPHYIAAVTETGEEQEVEVREDIYASNGIKLLAKGARIDRAQFVRLTQHRLRTPLDCALSSERQLNAAALAAEAGQLLDQDPLLARLAARTGDPLAVRHGLAGLHMPLPLGFRLTVMKARRGELFTHSLRSALIAHMLGLRLAMPKNELDALALAALCHDLGEMHTDPALLAPGRRIAAEERRFIHVHPITGYVLLQDLATAPRATLNGILQHHERLDGSGYPYALGGERIGALGRIMAVVEVTEGLLRRCHQQRVDVMLRLNHARFDPAVMHALRDLMGTKRVAVDDGLPGSNLEQQFRTVAAGLAAWDAFRGFLEDSTAPESAERDVLSFLFERMREIRSLTLQAGLNVEDVEASLDLAGDDAELLGEMKSALDELLWRMAEIANEAELKAARLDDAVRATLDNFIRSLRPAVPQL